METKNSSFLMEEPVGRLMRKAVASTRFFMVREVASGVGLMQLGHMQRGRYHRYHDSDRHHGSLYGRN